MYKYIILFFMFVVINSCKTPDEDIAPAKSAAAKIVRFRVYRNVNIYYDAAIGDSTIAVAIPDGIDRSALHPEVLVSSGATVFPESGDLENFTGKVNYTVTSENGEVTKIYEVEVKNGLIE